MGDIRETASRYQALLTDSQAQCEELERKYGEAKRLLRDYQEREKDLLEREAEHLEQLRAKDSHYAAVISGMRSQVGALEAQLSQQQAKRTSLVEAQLSELQAQLAREVERKRSNAEQMSRAASGLPLVTIPSSSASSTPASTLSHPGQPSSTDISPALAYQPAARAPHHKTTVAVSSSLDSASATDSSAAIPVPATRPLDSSQARAKADVVRQSQVGPCHHRSKRKGWHDDDADDEFAAAALPPAGRGGPRHVPPPRRPLPQPPRPLLRRRFAPPSQARIPRRQSTHNGPSSARPLTAYPRVA